MSGAEAADTMHLFGMDYSAQVWSQCWREWNATSLVLWTPGNRTGLLAAAGKIRCLAFGLDETHVELLDYVLTCEFAKNLAQNEFADQLAKLAKTVSPSAASKKNQKKPKAKTKKEKEDDADEHEEAGEEEEEEEEEEIAHP